MKAHWIASLLFATGALMAADREKLVTNGRIYTMDAARSTVEAMIVRGDRIWRTGTAAEMRRLAAPDAEIVDLGGRFAMPGFVDAHVHFVSGGFSLLEVWLKDCADEADFQKRVAGYAAKFRPGEWVVADGWDHEAWPDKKLPAAALLDAVVADRPIWLTRYDGHMGVANTMALRLAGVTRDTKSPAGGEIGRDAAGNPDGILRDNAMSLIDRVIPGESRERVEEAIREAIREAGRCGVTTVLEMGTSPTALAVYNALQNEGRLTTRIYACPPAESLDHLKSLGITSGFGSDRLRIEGVKLFVDGSMGSGTALFFAPYKDRPQTSGLAVHPDAELESQIRAADAAGFQLNIHAIGDKAIWLALDDISRLPPRDRRAKIEHVQVVRRQDFELFKRTGAIASVEPCHILDDMHWCEKRVGERCRDGYVYGSLLRAGIPLAFGTDWPVEPLNPWLGVYAAVTRLDLDGKPAGGWFPEERMPLVDALSSYTMGSAYSCFMENQLGSIEPGKLADLVVLDRDPFKLPPEQLKDVRTWLTMIGGSVVYEAP